MAQVLLLGSKGPCICLAKGGRKFNCWVEKGDCGEMIPLLF